MLNNQFIFDYETKQLDKVIFGLPYLFRHDHCRCVSNKICIQLNYRNMKQNMGGTDRMIRFIIAIVIGVLYWQKIIDGTLAYVLLGMAGIFLLTSFVSFCPLYSIVGLNTCKIKK